MSYDRYDWRRRFDEQGFGYPKPSWTLIPEGWRDMQGAGGNAAGAGLGMAEAANPFSWTPFLAEQGLGLAGKAFSYMFGGQRKERKEAKAEYRGDRKRIEASMNEQPYSLADINTFAVRGMHNYRATVAKQMADIADINATDVAGAIGEQAAVAGQDRLMDAFVRAREARFDKRARDRYVLLQASANRYSQAMG